MNSSDTDQSKKAKLASDTLTVASEALVLMRGGMGGAAELKDVVSVFNSALKAHKELVQSINAALDTSAMVNEKASEQELAKEYKGELESILDSLM